MALTQGLIDSYWRRYNQRRALTGLPSSYQEMRGTLDPMLDQAYHTDLQERDRAAALANQNRQLNIAEQAQKDAARAATVGGIAQTGGLIATGLLGYKALNNQAENTNIMKQYLLGGNGGAPPVAPAAGAGSGGAGILQGVGSGSTMPYPATGSGVAGIAPGMQPLEAGSLDATGTGLLGTASTVALPSALAAGAGQLLGKPVSQLLGTHPKTTGDVMSIGGGAGVGFALGGPVGGLIGAGIGALGSFASDIFGF